MESNPTAMYKIISSYTDETGAPKEGSYEVGAVLSLDKAEGDQLVAEGIAEAVDENAVVEDTLSNPDAAVAAGEVAGIETENTVSTEA